MLDRSTDDQKQVLYGTEFVFLREARPAILTMLLRSEENGII